MKQMMDHAKVIREALTTILHTPGWNKPCVASCLRCDALKALSALEEERRRLRWRWQFIEDHLQSLTFLSSAPLPESRPGFPPGEARDAEGLTEKEIG